MSQFVAARSSHVPALPCLCPRGRPSRRAGRRRRRRKVPPSSTSFRGRGQPSGPDRRQERESEKQRDRDREKDRDGGGAGGSALRGTRLPSGTRGRPTAPGPGCRQAPTLGGPGRKANPGLRAGLPLVLLLLELQGRLVRLAAGGGTPRRRGGAPQLPHFTSSDPNLRVTPR